MIFFRLTAIFDSCFSGTVLDLPFIYDCDGKPKQQKFLCKKTAAINLLDAGVDFEEVVTTMASLEVDEREAQEITVKTRSSQADVIVFSGCKDDQTSADGLIKGFGRTGVACYAFIKAIKNGRSLTFTGLLKNMRDIIAKEKKYSQKIQMSTGYPTDMNIPFIL